MALLFLHFASKAQCPELFLNEHPKKKSSFSMPPPSPSLPPSLKTLVINRLKSRAIRERERERERESSLFHSFIEDHYRSLFFGRERLKDLISASEKVRESRGELRGTQLN